MIEEEKTPKQWHRYFIKKTAEYIKNNNIEGSFVECGVKQGSSSVIMAKTLNTQGYLFDTWKGFPSFSKIDAFNDNRQRQLERRLETGNDTYIDCINNLSKNEVLYLCKMIRGDIGETLPEFIKNNKININMLHIDTDLYEPAKIALENFYNLVVEGGIIFFHDYGDPTWPGIKKIIDDLSIKNNISLYIFDKNKLFSAVIIKNSKNTEKYIKYIEDINV